MHVTINGLSFNCASLKDAQLMWISARVTSGWGASDVPNVFVYEGRRRIARISYNGRVWSPERWTVSSKLLLEAPSA